MTRKFIYLLSAITAMAVAALFAQEGTTKAGEGTLMLSNKTYKLVNAVAYESTIDDEEAVVAVLSGATGCERDAEGSARSRKGWRGGRFQKAVPQAGLQENGRTEVLERGRG